MLTIGTPLGGAFTLSESSTAVTISENTTDERILAVIALPAGLLGLSGMMKGDVFISHTNSTNTKTYRVYLGNGNGSVGGALTVGTSTAFVVFNAQASTSSSGFSFWIGNRASQAVNAGGIYAGRAITANLSVATGTIDTSLAQKIIITGTKATGTETVTLENYNIRVMK
jgi:hypothetical protein